MFCERSFSVKLNESNITVILRFDVEHWMRNDSLDVEVLLTAALFRVDVLP